MVWENHSLHTRLHSRRRLVIPARVDVHPDHADQLRFSFPDNQTHVHVGDVSEGGMGLFAPMFLPRNARVEIRVSMPEEDGDPPPVAKPFRAVVRRCVMTDVKPTYQIGLQFVDRDSEAVRDLLGLAKTEDKPHTAISEAPADTERRGGGAS